jgi:glycerol-3-phosphate acyltransferase PlsY
MKMSGHIVASIALILFGYLLGSIPSAYLAGKWLKGLDLREYGSGTVSGSMVYEHVARWAVVPVGLFDIFKATIPAWLGIQFGLGEAVAAMAGLAAAIGHNWPIYLGFTGGRGISAFLGTWLVIFPWAFPWMLAFLALGWILGDSAPFALVGMVTLPIFSHVIDGPSLVLPISIAVVIITLVKRIEANHRPLPKTAPERRRMLLLRALFDRDVLDHKAWIRREPLNE